jgi:large conductance mechanosensitive channel
MKKFMADFKKFISKGNILDMAVGVIVGNAFSAIVKSFTDKIIMPLINYLLLLVTGGKDGLSSIYTFLKKSFDENGAIYLANSIYIDWGAFITAVLNFFIIALTLFIVLRVAMKSNEFFKKNSEEFKKKKPTKAEKVELKKRGVSVKNKAELKKLREEKAAEEKAKKEKADAEAKAKAEADRLANPTQEDLLKEIRDLLKAKNN